jgi:xanthine/uracil permease
MGLTESLPKNGVEPLRNKSFKMFIAQGAQAFVLLSLASCGLIGCETQEQALVSTATVDMCCSITVVEVTETSGEVLGCGQRATYAYENDKWVQKTIVQDATAGSAASKLNSCPTSHE